jgi:hypothetical protein
LNNSVKGTLLAGAFLCVAAAAVGFALTHLRDAQVLEPGVRSISARCAVAAGDSLSASAIRIRCGLDKAGVQAVLDKTLAGIDVAKLVADVRAGERTDIAEIDTLAARLGVAADRVRPTLEALAKEPPSGQAASARLLRILVDQVPVRVQSFSEDAAGGDRAAALPVTAAPAETVTAPVADAAATLRVRAAAEAGLVVDCAAADAGKLTAATVEIACGPDSDEIAALVNRTISAADLGSLAGRVARGEAGDSAAIDRLTQQLHLSRDGLMALLAQLGASGIPAEQTPTQLARMARARGEALLVRIAALPDSSPESHALRDEAAKALQDGEQERVETLIAAAQQAVVTLDPAMVRKAVFRPTSPPLATPAEPAHSTPQEETNLLAPGQGGEILTAPREDWSNLGGSGGFWAHPGEEAVIGFGDKKSATFSRFAILIEQSRSDNVKDFEVLAGDDDPTGAFRSLGKFTTRNIRIMKDPFQEFSFLQTTGKYFKFRVLSAHSDGQTWIWITQVRLFGRIAP